MNPSSYEGIILAAGCSRRLQHITHDVPKALLPVAGKRIIERTLEDLEAAGLEQVTMIVGYLKEVFYREIGDRYGKLKIRYIESPHYEKTGHAWSLYQIKPLWEKEKRPILLVHGDVVYDPAILRTVLSSPHPDVLGVDNRFEAKTNDEVLVCGSPERVKRIQKITESPADVLGEVVGMNKWSADFLDELFAFMDTYFKKYGTNYNWEPVMDAFLQSSNRLVLPAMTEGKSWMNVNYEEDLREADALWSRDEQ